MSRELGTAEIARRHGIDRKTAYRWMRAIFEEYGPAVVCRRGKRGVYVTTEDAWRTVAVLVERRAAEEARFEDIELRLQVVEQRQDRTTTDVTELFRRVNAPRVAGARC